jgi:hypothetical protein
MVDNGYEASDIERVLKMYESPAKPAAQKPGETQAY